MEHHRSKSKVLDDCIGRPPVVGWPRATTVTIGFEMVGTRGPKYIHTCLNLDPFCLPATRRLAMKVMPLLAPSSLEVLVPFPSLPLVELLFGLAPRVNDRGFTVRIFFIYC